MNPQNLRAPWPRGVSGNPHGRPAGLVSAIRKQTKDGAELVKFFCTVFRDPAAELRDRMQAATWLADRAYGRPTQSLDLELSEPMIPASEIARAGERVTEKLNAYISGGHRPSTGSDRTRVDGGDPARPVDRPATAQDQGSLHERLDRLMRGDSP